MRYGFIKVCAVTPEIKVADVKFNTEKIIEAVKESADNGSQLTVFPELCICGYTCGDLFNQSALLNGVENAVYEISRATEGIETLVFVGAPVVCEGKLYNCAVAICNGKILGVVPKTYIPDYGEFYEGRHFSTAPDKCSYITVGKQRGVPFGTEIIFQAENCPAFTVAAEICEDLWAPQSPSVKHTQAGANIVVNLSCSDETVGKADYRRDLVKMQSGKLICGYVYCDAGDGESATDMAFAGHNIIAENGSVLKESKLFDNGLIYSEIDVELLSADRRKMASSYYGRECTADYKVCSFVTSVKEVNLSREFPKTPFVPSEGAKLSDRAELILSVQSKGLEKRLKHTLAKTAVIGISGGLDSALALLVTCRAFKSLNKDFKDIIAVTMPGFGTTAKTKNNSLALIKTLGVTEKVIPITDSVLQHFKDIGHDRDKLDVTYENSQARMRTLILMDIANQTNGLVVGTGDLSELALGWATYNGDHMSMYGVNVSVPKTLVKHLVQCEANRIGGECKGILESIINTEISPELLPPSDGEIQQKTEDLVGPYVLHDFFLYYAIRCGFTPEKIQFLAVNTFTGIYDGQTVNKWLKVFYKRFFNQQFKRSCLPDGVKVGSVALSPRGDWRMPSDATSRLWLDELD